MADRRALVVDTATGHPTEIPDNDCLVVGSGGADVGIKIECTNGTAEVVAKNSGTGTRVQINAGGLNANGVTVVDNDTVSTVTLFAGDTDGGTAGATLEISGASVASPTPVFTYDNVSWNLFHEGNLLGSAHTWTADQSYTNASILVSFTATNGAEVIQVKNDGTATLDLRVYGTAAAGSLLGTARANGAFLYCDNTNLVVGVADAANYYAIYAGGAIQSKYDSNGNTFTSQRGAIGALTISSNAITIDCAVGNMFTLTMSANVNTVNLTNLPAAGYGYRGVISVLQNATGGYTFTFPSNWKPRNGSDLAIQTGSDTRTRIEFETFDQGTRVEYDVCRMPSDLPVRWNAADKSSDITLSNSNATATRGTGSAGSWRGVRSITSHNTGKRIARCANVVDGSTNGAMCFGVATSGYSLTTQVGGAGSTSWGFQANNTANPSAYFNGTQTGYSGSVPPAAAATDESCFVAVDFDTGRIWLGNENSTNTGIAWAGGGNPSAGTTPTYTFTPGTTLYLALSMQRDPQECRLYNHDGEGLYALPTGFSMWG